MGSCGFVIGNTLKYLQVPFRLSRWFRFHPFCWDVSAQQPDLVTSASARRHWYLNIFINVVHYVFVQCRCIQVNLDTSTRIVERIFVVYVTVCYFSFVMTHIQYAGKSEAIVRFLRNYMRFLQEFQDTMSASGKSISLGGRASQRFVLPSKCAAFMAFIQGCFLGNFLFMVFLSILRPWSQDLLSSVLAADPQNLALWERLVFGLLQAYIIMSNLEVLTFWVSFMLLFVFTAVDMINTLRFRLQVQRWGRPKLVPESVFQLYRVLHLQVDEFSRVLMPIFWVNHVVIMMIAVFCAYAAVRLHGVLAAGLGFVSANTTILLLVMMNMLANLNGRSKALLYEVKWEVARIYSKQRIRPGSLPYIKWLGRQVRCRHDLRIRMGSIFFYDKPIVLTTLQILLQTFINLLLLH